MNDNTLRAVCGVLRCALFGEEAGALPDGTDWGRVFAELSAHTVAGLPGDILSDLPKLDAHTAVEWKTAVMRQADSFYRLLFAQEQIVALLSAEGLRFAVIKGSAAAVYYPRPVYRAAGDIDLLVAPEDFDRAVNALKNDGWRELDGSDDPLGQLRHIEFEKDGCIVELHRFFACLNDADAAEHLDKCIFSGLDNVAVRAVEGSSFPSLPDMQNGLVLLQHINHHIQTGIGLRQIIDWMMFVSSCLDCEMWNGGFLDAARDAGLEKLAVAVTAMCRRYFGLKADTEWCAGVADETCDELMRYIMDCGNMGHRSKSNALVAALVRNHGIIGCVRNLQRGGCRKWKALEKHPYLRPFAWAYMICRYISRWREQRLSAGSLSGSADAAAKADRLCRELGVTMWEDGVSVQGENGYELRR